MKLVQRARQPLCTSHWIKMSRSMVVTGLWEGNTLFSWNQIEKLEIPASILGICRHRGPHANEVHFLSTLDL